MSQLEEYELIACCVGKKVNMDNLKRLDIKKEKGANEYQGCEKYVVSIDELTEFILLQKSSELNKLNPGSSLSLVLYLIGGVLKGGRIKKNMILIREDGLRQGYETDVEETDLLRVGEILNFILEEGINNE